MNRETARGLGRSRRRTPWLSSRTAVTRADHTAAVFTVDKVDVCDKSAFPTVEVCRNADRPGVQLITCGGYDPTMWEYLDNTVIFAHQTSSHPV